MSIINKIKNRLKICFDLHNIITVRLKKDEINLKGCKIYHEFESKGCSNIQFTEIRNYLKIDHNVDLLSSFIEGITHIGKNSYIKELRTVGKVEIGTDCKVYKTELHGHISLDNFSSIWGPNINLISTSKSPIIIGRFCSIARNVTMQTFNHNYKKITTYFIGKNLFNEKWDNETVSKGGITIKNDVWIGAHSIILGGVTIGNGALIAANSLINEDVPDYAIVAGIPGKIIGYRFSEVVIEKLLNLRWWDWDIDKIKKSKKLFEKEITEKELENFK